MPFTKKKKVSKKNKSSWRKHADIKDVEDFLEAQRQSERIGTFTDKKDSELFLIDATPLKKKSYLTNKQKRKENASKPPKTYQILENTSKVQDPIVKRNHVKLKTNGRDIEEEVRNPTKPRHIQANKDRLKYYEKLDKKLAGRYKPKTFNEDIWEEKDFRDSIPGLKDEKGWISKELSLHVTANIGKPVVKVHDSIRHKTTKAKTFEPPHPGMSYNPSLTAHQDLIEKVVKKEEKIIKEEKHLKRVTTDMFSKVSAEERNQRWIEEMNNEEKPNTDGEETNETEDINSIYKTVNPPVTNKKKTKTKRNKEQRHKELTKKTAEKKALKKKLAEINRLKSIKAEIITEEEKLNISKKNRKKTELKMKFEPKRLGRLKYTDPEVDVNMPEDIAGNLRNIKTESSLLIDRFKNLQKRNILPTTVYVGKRKQKKIKRFVRSSHKEPEVSIFNKSK